MKKLFAILLTGTILMACNNAPDTTPPAEDHTMTTEPQVDTIPPDDSMAPGLDSAIRK